MRRVLSWWRKEWAQHGRALLILTALVPICVAALFWFEPLFLSDAVALTVFLPAVLVAYTLCLGADVFASERTRGTDRVIQRLPHGVIPSFVAKTAFLLCSSLGLVVWAALCIDAGWWITSDADQATGYTQVLLSGKGVMLIPIAMAFVLWVAFASTWIGRSGLTAAAAPILLGLGLLPTFLIIRDHPYYLDWDWAWIPMSAIVLAVAVCGAWLSYSFGWRHGAVRRRAMVWGLSWLCLSGGGAYGLTFWSLRDYLDLRADDPELRLGWSWLGKGERFVYVNASRGDDWSPGDGNQGRKTPPRAYRLDLSNGSFVPLADYYEMVQPPGRAYTSEAWHRTVDRVRVNRETGSVILDAERGVALVPQPRDVEPPTLPGKWPRSQVPDGWIVLTLDPDSGYHVHTVMDLSGEITWRRAPRQSLVVLQPHRILTKDRRANGRGLVEEPWMLRDLAEGTATPASNPPSDEARVLDYHRQRVLVLDGGEAFSWDPEVGTRERLRWRGHAPSDIYGINKLGPQFDGKAYVQLIRGTATEDGRWAGSPSVIARLDPDTNSIVEIQTLVVGQGIRYVGTGADDALWLIEDECRLVRLGPEPDTRTVIFPTTP